MTTIAEKKAKIAKLRGLGRDVSKYEAKLKGPEINAPISAPPGEILPAKEGEAKLVRRLGRPPRHG